MDMLGAICLIEEELCHRGELAPVQQELPNSSGQFGTPRLAGDQDPSPFGAQRRSQKLNMSCFSASFRPLECDEETFVHESRTIIIRYVKRFIACFLLLAGCAVPSRVGEEKAARPEIVPPHPLRTMIVYVPQTDEAAASWPKWFAKNPDLRMVIAMSPRFTRVAASPQLKAQLSSLEKAGRLEIGLQIPNAPILPLLIEDPPYGYPDDVVQLIAQAKAGFFKTWNFLPKGLVLPYGAVSPKLISSLDRLGFSWVIGALGAPPVDGPYQSGSLQIWDGSPSGKPAGTVIRVWDERPMKERPLDGWILETKAKGGSFLLPHDLNVSSVPLDVKASWKPRTWDGTDWSPWFGAQEKNSAWKALRRTRETLEKYKNSGQASVQRLDVAFEEIYSAQNSNYFASLGNLTLSPALVEEREHEFEATLLGVYRVIGQPPPEDLFAATTGTPVAMRTSSTTVNAERFPDGREHVSIGDAVGDALVPGGADIVSLDVWAATDSVHWIVTLASATPCTIEIYVDLNGQPNVGTPTFLAPSPYVTSPVDAWEFAISMVGQMATLYRTQGAGTYGIVQTFPVVTEGSRYHVTIPRDLMRGSPRRWGYQVLASGNTLSDFIDPLEISQKDLWQDLSTGKRNDIPFVRVRSK
jgi:hypothetical protein